MVSFASLTGVALVDIWLSAIITAVIAVITLGISFTVGYYIAHALNTAIKTLLEKAGLEKWVDDHELSNALLGFRITQVITIWVKTFVIVASLGFGFSAVEGFIGASFFVTQEIILPFTDYLLGIATSLIVIGGALFIAKFISNEVKKGDILFSHQIAGAVHLAIAYFALIAVLPTLLPGPGTEIASLLTFFLQALVVGIGLAIGLAFGLGLKEVVSKSALKHQGAFEKYVVNIGKK